MNKMNLETVRSGNTKAIVSVPGWVQSMGRAGEDVNSTQMAYSYVPLVYRALRLRCDSLTSVPIRIMRGEQEVAWPYPQPLDDLVWKTEASLLLAGAAYWEKMSNTVAVKGVQWLNPYTMEVELMKRDGIPMLQFRQNMDGGAIWTQDEIVYFKEFNPTDDIKPGVSATDAGLADAQVMRYVTRFAGKFFEGGAMPVTLLAFEGNISQGEMERTQTYFKRMVSGIGRAWKYIAVRNNVTPTQLTPPLNELAMNDLQDEARYNVALAFGIPQTMLADAANYATAKEHRLSFWQDTVKPSGNMLASVINRQLLEPLGMEMFFDFEQLDIFQEDESQRSESLQRLIASGVPLKTAMEILGYDLMDDQWAVIDASMLEDENEEQQPNEMVNVDINREMTRWQKMATKRLKNGQSPRLFVSDIIPPALHGAVQVQVEQCETEDEMKAIFQHAKEWGTYP